LTKNGIVTIAIKPARCSSPGRLNQPAGLGTRHEPGIQPADVQELIEHGAKAVVLSKAFWERL